MNITDFEKSFICWSGKSEGKFKIVSILNYRNELNKKITFGLTQNVLAGNVYNPVNLIKNPPYLFQLISNNENQKIFRTDLPSNKYEKLDNLIKRNKIKDTDLKNIFNNFNLKIIKKYVIKCKNIKEIIKYFKKYNFVSRIKLHNFVGTNFYIEFPINHINISRNLNLWQAETGPVLFPSYNKTKDIKFLPSFLMFNSFNQIDVFYDYPFGERKKKQYLKSLKCKIEIFGYKL